MNYILINVPILCDKYITWIFLFICCTFTIISCSNFTNNLAFLWSFYKQICSYLIKIKMKANDESLSNFKKLALNRDSWRRYSDQGYWYWWSIFYNPAFILHITAHLFFISSFIFLNFQIIIGFNLDFLFFQENYN